MRRREPLYKVNFPRIERALDVRGSSDGNYGRCDNLAVLKAERRPVPRATYAWRPSQCKLRDFAQGDACPLLRGKQVLVVGDSTAGQLFYSLVIQLKGTFGMNARRISGLDEATASACNGTVRLSFARNDLLILHPKDHNFFKATEPGLKLHPFAERAGRDADVLLLSVGHHFPSFNLLLEKRYRERMPPNAFFHLNLNMTLSELRAIRRQYGHHPASVMLVSSVIPVPACRQYDSPLTLQQALYAQSVAIAPEFAGLRLFWDGVLKQNSIAQWMAMELGMSFLDISALSLQRPDGQMAHFSPKNDCLHSCLPGPVDTWIQLAFNAIEGQTSAFGSNQPHPAPRTQRWFALGNESRWLRKRGISSAFETCSKATIADCWISSQHISLHKQAAWLFARQKNMNASASSHNIVMHTFLQSIWRQSDTPPSPPFPPSPPQVPEGS